MRNIQQSTWTAMRKAWRSSLCKIGWHNFQWTPIFHNNRQFSFQMVTCPSCIENSAHFVIRNHAPATQEVGPVKLWLRSKIFYSQLWLNLKKCWCYYGWHYFGPAVGYPLAGLDANAPAMAPLVMIRVCRVCGFVHVMEGKTNAN